MSNLRFCTDNKALGKTVLNGTGGGAPARSETAPYIMEKALQRSRLLPWLAPASMGSDWKFDIDLGAAMAIDCWGWHGLEQAPGVNLAEIQVHSATSYPTFTTRGIINVATGLPRDGGQVLGSPITARYWRFNGHFLDAPSVGAFSLGKWLLGPKIDIGFRQSGTYRRPRQRKRRDDETGGGNILVHDLGSSVYEWDIPFGLLVDAQGAQAKLQALADAPGSFAIYDPDDVFAEVVLADEGRADFGRGPMHNLWTDSRIRLLQLR